VERVPLFYIDDVEYSMPAKIPGNVALKYLRKIRTDGVEVAGAWLLEEVIGTEAYEALMNYDGLTIEQLNQVIAIVERHALGSVEARGNG